MTIKEAAKYVALCPDTIRDLMAKRRFPFRNVSQGRKPAFRFDVRELDLWIDRLPGVSIKELRDK